MKLFVPTDYSIPSKNAVIYAIDLADDYGNGEVEVVHFVEKESEVSGAESTMKTFLAGVPTPKNIELRSRVLIGDFFDRIGNYAKENYFRMIIMGTSGARGLQKLIGSRAVRVIQRCQIPFIVVQKEMPRELTVERIAIPITLEVEDKKILNIVCAVAKPLEAQVLLMYEDSSDEFTGQTIARNLNFAKSYLRNRGIEVQSVDVGHNMAFDEAVVTYAKAHECDLIASINHHNDGILNLFGAGFDQNLLENSAHIPVMTINAKPMGDVRDIFMTTR